jgi:uncharacterized protein YbjQ (UPF0145 family)
MAAVIINPRSFTMPIQEHSKVTGLSGNEIFCLKKMQFKPGQLCIGNSVVSLGVAGGFKSGLSTLAGGEVSEITNLIHQGRQNAYDRIMQEVGQNGGVGLTGVSFDLINHGSNLEFLAIGSAIHNLSGAETLAFSSSADAQQLYCQIDSGFKPHRFVFGNVAYSIGVGGNIGGAFRSLKRGEVAQFTEIFDRTRHLALTRLKDDAKKAGANAVVGIQTSIMPFLGAQEMLMVGTASTHPALNQYLNNPVTSDMTNEELWNMVNIGYLPIELVMGVSVYSLGFASGISSFFQSLAGGQVESLTEILYEAREKALERLQMAAQKCGADEVIGVKTRVYNLGGGLVEFMVIGTAVKKFDGVTTVQENLPVQATIQDRETFVDSTQDTDLNLSQTKAASATALQKGPVAIFFIIFAVIFEIIKIFLTHR